MDAADAGLGGSDRLDLVVDLVVDIANVVGSRPDGWWRDRAAAATRLIRPMAALSQAEVPGPDARQVRVGQIVAVVEGQARAIPDVSGITLVRAEADGDEAVVQVCTDLIREGGHPLAVTADRGLRARLPVGVAIAGPQWLRDLLDRLADD